MQRQAWQLEVCWVVDIVSRMNSCAQAEDIHPTSFILGCWQYFKEAAIQPLLDHILSSGQKVILPNYCASAQLYQDILSAMVVDMYVAHKRPLSMSSQASRIMSGA